MTAAGPMKPMKPRYGSGTAPVQVQQKVIVTKSLVIPAPPPAPRKRTADEPTIVHKVKADKKARRWSKIVAIALFVVALLILPEFLSQILLIAYAIFAIIRRLVVGLTFGLAVLVLLLSPLFTFITGSSGNGAVLASYSFGLLLVGFVQLIIEYRRMQRK